MIDTIDELMTRRPQVEFAVKLTPNQVEEFTTLGFTRIARITADEELEWLAEVYDRLFAERVAPVPGAFIELMRSHEAGRDVQSQIIMPEVRFAELRQTALWRNGRALAAQLMGVDATQLVGWGHMIRKPPRDNGALPWHQDEAYWDPAFDYRALACWMPLDPATVESGCMSFIPGSHRGDLRMHRRFGADFSDHVVHVENVNQAEAVAAPVAAGGAVFHHCRTLHSSGPNRSERVRRAYSNEWQIEPAKREHPAPRPWFDEVRKAQQERQRTA
jgi:ectoine hydroxylase-related dioxygenase (phytanoyl-CoA dioxygenase family)